LKSLIIKPLMMLLIAVPLLVTGCQNRHTEFVRSVSNTLLSEKVGEYTDTLNSEMMLMAERGIVLERVKTIFSLVKADYMGHGGIFRNDMFDHNYCSKSWNNLLMAVRGKESQTYTWFFEIEHWALAREPGFVTFDNFEVTTLVMEPRKFASVTFTVYDAESYTPGRIDLVYEDGRWVIDNFYDFKYKINVRQSMYDFLDNDII